MKKLKLALIGTGMAFERLHLPALLRLKEQIEIVGVCNKTIEKAQRAVELLGCNNIPIFSDYNEMMDTVTDIQAVDIMVPISENYEVAKDVIKRGKHVIAEKPFAATLEGAKELEKLTKKENVKVLVAENYRYAEENKVIKNLLDTKAIGDVCYFIDNYITDFSSEMMKDTFSSKEWRQHPAFKGGIFLDSAIHHIARHRFLFGNAVKIYANGIPSQNDFCNYTCINALIKFNNNVTGHYSYFNIGKETQAPLVGLRIFGTNGEIYLEDKDCGFVNLSYRDGTHEVIPYVVEEGYYNELLNFYNSVINNEQIISTPEKEVGDIQMICDILSAIS